MELADLDHQLSEARSTAEALELSDEVWGNLASTIHKEVASLPEQAVAQLGLTMLVPPIRYVEEMTAFQAWMDFAFEQHENPVVVRAQVMTQLYVSFVWLRDSVMRPIAQALPEPSAFTSVEKYLSGGRRRGLRNAVAHGRWCYLPDFGGLECWAEPGWGQPHERFEVSHRELEAWQLLSRGTAIAALLALSIDESATAS